jgi:hypothetical protein
LAVSCLTDTPNIAGGTLGFGERLAHKPSDHLLEVLSLFIDCCEEIHEVGFAKNEISGFTVKVAFDDACTRA